MIKAKVSFLALSVSVLLCLCTTPLLLWSQQAQAQALPAYSSHSESEVSVSFEDEDLGGLPSELLGELVDKLDSNWNATGGLPLIRLLEQSGDPTQCKSSKECHKPKICVTGKCTCPVLYRGSESCAPTVLPNNDSDWCVMPINSPVFKKYTIEKYNKNKRQKKKTFWNPSNAEWKFFGDATGSKLSTFRENSNFAKCAVVGSSNSLTKKEYGKLIDSHGVVIRFNAAPTRGFQKYVGSRTTIRVQNIRYCGSTSRSEHCIHYSRNQDPKSHQCKRWRRCKKIKLNNQVVEYIQHYWRVVPSPPGKTDRGKRDAKLSAGFFGIVLAMHVCAEVNVFGFSQGEHHYYKKGDKKFMKGKPFYTRHRWIYESACMNLLRKGAYEGITVYN